MVADQTPMDVDKSADSPVGDGDNNKPDLDLLTVEDVKEHARHIEKAVITKEPRFMLRVLRTLVSTRKKLNNNVLRKIIFGFYTHSVKDRDALPMETDAVSSSFRIRSGKTAAAPLLPEIDVYIHLLVLLHLLDTGKEAQSVRCSDALIVKLQNYNRRTIDLLAAKCYFYYSRSYEQVNQLSKIRSFLHSQLRTATLRNDFEGQAVILNCLLRNYLHYNLYDQADKLVSKSVFPETASNNEWARFLYYLGRIKAIQLEYSEAHKNLLQAIRKAPQLTAVGFKQTVHKLAITVELLLGDIPDKSLFRQPTLRRALQPYFQLTQAVRMGDLKRFSDVLQTYGNQFQSDHTFTLILRLHHNVIKTGIRMINLSYSRISLADIAHKLQLDSPEDAEFIIAKAIKDGVIEAIVDHEKGYMQSKKTSMFIARGNRKLLFISESVSV
uniref:PCI domain-containing protein n=1 Tax=Strigamia maritima TaxID=126957 RepID=T1IVT3_STRMM